MIIYRPTKNFYPITSPRGYRTINVGGRLISSFHRGYDTGVPIGVELYPTRDIGGTVYVRYEKNGFGNYVAIKWDDGMGTWIAHMSKIVVQNGQRINYDTLLGYSGNTGLSTAPHVHHEEHTQFDKMWTNYAFGYTDRIIQPDYIVWNNKIKEAGYLGGEGIINNPNTEEERLILEAHHNLNQLYQTFWKNNGRANKALQKHDRYILESPNV